MKGWILAPMFALVGTQATAVDWRAVAANPKQILLVDAEGILGKGSSRRAWTYLLESNGSSSKANFKFRCEEGEIALLSIINISASGQSKQTDAVAEEFGVFPPDAIISSAFNAVCAEDPTAYMDGKRYPHIADPVNTASKFFSTP